MAKRIFDIGLAGIGLLLTFPFVLIACLAIRLSSPGRAIFAQTRVGRNRKPFTCYKLRTMEKGTRIAGTHEVSAASVTSVGKFLRASKLDELPQLWNVLRGDMSLVGPRPCLPVQEELIEERDKRGVLDLAPGITGLAQIEGIDMSEPVRLAERDAEYVRQQSFPGDLKILVSTVTGSGRGDRVSVDGSSKDSS